MTTNLNQQTNHLLHWRNKLLALVNVILEILILFKLETFLGILSLLKPLGGLD
jgi:hypothetical protein